MHRAIFVLLHVHKEKLLKQKLMLFATTSMQTASHKSRNAAAMKK